MSYTTLAPEEIRRNVYEEAKKQFLIKGIEHTEMKQLAQAVGIGRTTLYRYFPSIDHLALMAIVEFLQEMQETQAQKQQYESMCGYDALSAHYHYFIDALLAHPEMTRFCTHFDLRYSQGYPDIPEASAYRDYLQKLYAWQASLIQRGIADGSIRPDVDLFQILYGVGHALFGYAQRTQSHSQGIETRRTQMHWIADSLLVTARNA